MPNWLIQLLDARTLLGFALGIAAAAFAIWLQARAEHGRWLRQQRLDAFIAFVGALDACVRPRQRWQLSWGKREEAAEREAFFDQLEALDRAGGRIHLLSERAVNEATLRAYRGWAIEINSALKSHDQDRLDRAAAVAGERYRDFLIAARAELGQRGELLSSAAIREFGLEDESKPLVDLPVARS